MTESVKEHLQLRLSNCLQTILELEPDLERLELGHALIKEYAQLKSFVDKVNQLRLDEEDVRRIEMATASFLEEIKVPLSLVQEPSVRRRPMQ